MNNSLPRAVGMRFGLTHDVVRTKIPWDVRLVLMDELGCSILLVRHVRVIHFGVELAILGV